MKRRAKSLAAVAPARARATIQPVAADLAAGPDAGVIRLQDLDEDAAQAVDADALSLVKPEELDWLGRPKPQGPRRLAMPSAGPGRAY